ncbi:MAG TPA: porin [Pseudomonadales bacterium]|nr:porin [Pseudomonadales bacterium]
MNIFNRKHIATNPSLVTVTALGLVLGALAATPAQAASGKSSPDDVAKQLEALSRKVQQLESQLAAQKAAPQYELEQKVKILERKQEIADEDAAKAKKETPVVVASEKGFGLKAPDGSFEFKLRGLVQADTRVFDNGYKGQYSTPAGTHNAIDNEVLRRARPIIEGTFYNKYGFRITPEFAGTATTLVDAYVEGNYDPAFKVRVGKFTPPLGLERLQSSADTKFNELSLVSDLIPARDVGIQVGGDLFDNTVNYTVGVFNGAIDGATADNSDNNTDKELQARVFAQPFINQPGFFQGLGLGVAVSSNDHLGTTGSTGLAKFKTLGQEDFFSYRTDTSATDTVIANGERTRLVPQFHYFNGNVGLTGEYVTESQDLDRFNGAGLPTQKATIDTDAWQLTAAWTITGEDQSLKGIKPAQNFEPGKGWGAWELVARVGELNVDKDAFRGPTGALGNVNSFADPTKSAQNAANIGVGVNWYLNKALRVSLDYDHTAFNWGGGGAAATPADRQDEDVLIGRVQASF